MSDTDIYKNRPALPATKSKTKRRRRRSENNGVFDETKERRRRSRNSGFRRLLHLMRKPHNEKRIWVSALIAALVMLLFAGLWQFWYKERVARERDREKEFYAPLQSPPPAESAAE